MKKLSNKSSWRLFVILPMIIFAAGMTLMAVISMTRDIDLVADNYYEKELKYQQQIDMQKNSVELDKVIAVQCENGTAVISTSDKKFTEGKSGEINFYRPSDASKDFKISFMPDESGKQTVSRAQLVKGLWKVKLNLSDAERSYVVEKILYME